MEPLAALSPQGPRGRTTGPGIVGHKGPGSGRPDPPDGVATLVGALRVARPEPGPMARGGRTGEVAMRERHPVRWTYRRGRAGSLSEKRTGAREPPARPGRGPATRSRAPGTAGLPRAAGPAGPAAAGPRGRSRPGRSPGAGRCRGARAGGSGVRPSCAPVVAQEDALELLAAVAGEVAPRPREHPVALRVDEGRDLGDPLELGLAVRRVRRVLHVEPERGPRRSAPRSRACWVIRCSHRPKISRGTNRSVAGPVPPDAPDLATHDLLTAHDATLPRRSGGRPASGTSALIVFRRSAPVNGLDPGCRARKCMPRRGLGGPRTAGRSGPHDLTSLPAGK